MLAIRLVAADTKEVIYEDAVQYYYWTNWKLGATILQSPADQNFQELKMLQDQKGDAKQRLARGIDVVINNIVDKIFSYKY